MWKAGMACCVVFAVATLNLGSRESHARPHYQKVFNRVYREIENVQNNCGNCHIGEKKTNLTDYGKAVEEALGAKNIRDEATIEAALKKAEGKLPRKKP